MTQQVEGIMATANTGGLVSRIKNILLTPKAEWQVIDGEPATIGGLMTGYVVPLAAIAPVATIIGLTVFGYQALGVAYRPSMNFIIATAVIGYVLALVGVWVNAQVISALATSFGGQPNTVQAMKVAAYGSTAGYLAGIFNIVPSLSMLAILGLYNLYLVYTGLPVLMKSPPEKSIGYIVVTIIVMLVLYMVMGAVAGSIALAVAPPVMPIVIGP
jgi:hypothetical protein